MSRPIRISLIAAALFLAANSTTLAQEVPELVTDRPDQTESSVVVPPGYTQLEIGWTHARNDDHGEDVRSHSIPEVLLRYGICERWELRLGHAGYTWEDIDFSDGSPSEDSEGWGDSEIGFKYYLWEEQTECWIPEGALLAGLTLPTGANGHSSERADPGFRFSFSHTLTETLSFGYNLGAAWETGEDDRGERDTGSVFQYTAVLGQGLTDRLSLFVEFFGDIPMSSPGTPAHYFDGGFTYLVTDNFQLDCSVGVGLSDDADDFFVGAGFSYRLPR